MTEKMKLTGFPTLDDVKETLDALALIEPLPKYSDVGTLTVLLSDVEGAVQAYHLASDGCCLLIGEGEGFDYWFDDVVLSQENLAVPGVYTVEGVVGTFYKGDGYSTDDDVYWTYKSVRPAVDADIFEGDSATHHVTIKCAMELAGLSE